MLNYMLPLLHLIKSHYLMVSLIVYFVGNVLYFYREIKHPIEIN